MKKIVALVLTLSLVLCCAASLAEGYGLGVSTGVGSSKSATAEKNGTAQVDATMCALVVDDEGKIVSCIFDVAQIKVPFTAAGEVVTDGVDLRTKEEKQGDYGMLPASDIGKEWFEQAKALADFCVGKTLEEAVAGIAVDEEKHVSTNADVLDGCTMKVTDFIEAMTKAYAQATAK